MRHLTLLSQALLVACAVTFASSQAFAGPRVKGEQSSASSQAFAGLRVKGEQSSAFGWADIQALRTLVRMP